MLELGARDQPVGGLYKRMVGINDRHLLQQLDRLVIRAVLITLHRLVVQLLQPLLARHRQLPLGFLLLLLAALGFFLADLLRDVLRLPGLVFPAALGALLAFLG
jgi:hypothetical protein